MPSCTACDSLTVAPIDNEVSVTSRLQLLPPAEKSQEKQKLSSMQSKVDLLQGLALVSSQERKQGHTDRLSNATIRTNK